MASAAMHQWLHTVAVRRFTPGAKGYLDPVVAARAGLIWDGPPIKRKKNAVFNLGSFARCSAHSRGMF